MFFTLKSMTFRVSLLVQSYVRKSRRVWPLEITKEILGLLDMTTVAKNKKIKNRKEK